jgi:hypothetical protein
MRQLTAQREEEARQQKMQRDAEAYQAQVD